mgnify:CR=1 FL=1
MIYLYRGQINKVDLTLDEKATNTTYDVLFKFTSRASGNTIYFTTYDIRTTARTNQFLIEETGLQDVYHAKIRLEAGQYDYVVYEMPLVSPNDIDPNKAVGILEEGSVTVFESDSRDQLTQNETKTNPTWDY